MRKQSWFISLMLLSVAGGLSWKLRADWQKGNQRYANLIPSGVKAGSAAPTAAGTAPAAVAGVELIAQNNLFSPDRNNVITPLVDNKKPAPPDPILIGAMDLGPGHTFALMAEGGPQPGPSRQVKEGEEIGGYKVVKIAGTFVIVSYEGQEKRIEISVNRMTQVAAPASSSPVAQTTQASPITTTSRSATVVAPVAPPAPPAGQINSNLMGETRTSLQMFGYNVPDNYPAGTVIDGYTKKEHPWPFGGKQIWWEKVK